MSRPHTAMIVRSVESHGAARINDLFAQEFGFREAELQEHHLLEWIHPDDQAAFAALLESGDGGLRARHRMKNGEWAELRWKIRDEDGKRSALGVRSATVAPDSEGMGELEPGESTTIAEALRDVSLIVEQQHPGMKCSILLLDETGGKVDVVVGPSLPPSYNEAVFGLCIGPAVGSCGTAAFWNERVIVSDIQADPLWIDLRENAETAGVSACWSQPITDQRGEVLGAMALYASSPRVPTQAQLDGLEVAARIVGLAIGRVRAVEALRLMERRIHEAGKIEALGILAGGIAHDFNNMIAAMLGNVELAMLKLDPSSEALPYLNDSVTAAFRARDLCQQMLACAGRGTLTRTAVECNRMVRELGDLLRVTVPKSASLVCEYSESDLYVEADVTQLNQILMNLMTNAVDSLKDGVGTVRVTIGPVELGEGSPEELVPGFRSSPGEYVQLVVTDTGIGMDESTQNRIFDPFFTTKATGRGLGLAAVQGMVRRHGGSISVDSEVGNGTTVTVRLPRTETPPTPDALETRAVPTVVGRHVLIVDDEPSVRRTFSAILGHVGFAVTCASDGEEAVEIYRRERDSIDCVLLDLTMPKKDGEETFKELQKIREDVRVVLSSGFTEQEVIDRFAGAGLAGVVQKPASAKTVQERVRAAIREGPTPSNRD